MDCPKCLGILEKEDFLASDKDVVEVEKCPLCHGFWFDRGELSTVLNSKNVIVDEAMPSTIPRTTELDLKIGNCPRCKKLMVRVPSMQDRRIFIDYCYVCDGFWVDGGEMDQLEKGGYIKRPLMAVYRKFSKVINDIRQAKNTIYSPGYERDDD